MWRRFGRFSDGGRINRRASERAIFAAAEQDLRNEIPLARNRWRRHTDFEYLRPHIDAAKQRASITGQGSDADATARAWLRAVALQAPHAALAQTQMDRHKHSFHNKSQRLMELIDFNDAYVAAVLAMPADQLHDFDAELKRLIDWFCKRVGAWTLSNDQFAAITHGLSREIAVYNAVRAAGFVAKMTNRSEDAFGIDMHITDPSLERRVNVDTKTSAAFHRRLLELLSEGRLSDADIELAEERGYTAVYNSNHEGERVRVVLWRIDHATLGQIEDFAFRQTESLIIELGEILNAYGESLKDNFVSNH